MFHVVAIKEVSSYGFFPMEVVRTNIVGTDKRAYLVTRSFGAIRNGAFALNDERKESTKIIEA